MLKRDSDLKNILLGAMQFCDSPNHPTREIQEKLLSGVIRAPTKDTIRLGRFKMDVLSMYWEAELDRHLYIVRWAVPDSSPQGHHNYFCCREDKVLFPLDADKVDIIMNRLQEFWVSRSMVCTTLCAGHAKTADKLWRFLHASLLETGPGQEAVDTRRKYPHPPHTNPIQPSRYPACFVLDFHVLIWRS